MAWNEPNGGDKDPWGGGRKNASPPDLDEAIRKMQQKLSRILGGKGGGTGASSGSPGKGGAIGLSVILIIAFIVWALMGIFIVAPAEQAVILRFGKYADVVGPGPHWIPPFIESKYVVDVKKVSTYSYTARMLTKDENIVSVTVAVHYRIGNPRDFLFNVAAPLDSLKEATASALRQVIGHTTLDSVLTVGREQVRQQVSEQLQKVLGLYNIGLVITDVVMQPAKPPEEVKEAFDDAIKAQEDEQRYINQGEAYARGVEPIAQGRAKRILQEAEAYKQQVTLEAKGNTSRFLALLAEYQRAPEVTRERLYLDAVEFVLSNTSKVLLDVEGSNNLVYLPLDRIIQQSKTATVKDDDAELESALEEKDQGLIGSTNDRGTTGRLDRDSYRGRGTY